MPVNFQDPFVLSTLIGGAMLLLAALALLAVGIIKSRHKTLIAQGDASSIVDRLKGGPDAALLPAESVREAFHDAGDEHLTAFGDQLSRISFLHYEGRLLPDPDPIFDSLGFFDKALVLTKTRLFALICFAVGSGGLSLLLLLTLFSKQWVLSLAVGGALFFASLLMALMLLWYGNRAARQVEEAKNRALVALSSFAPVFLDGTGVSLLVSEMLSYGEKMRSEVNQFSRLADTLASGDFAEGINTSVRQIMSEEVAPPLNDANHALTELAKSLAEKQEEGMRQLMDMFAASVAESLSVHLANLPDKLQILHQVAASSTDMMEEATATMIRSRDDNKLIHDDVLEAMRLMTLAKDDMAEEMASISDSMESLGGSVDKITRLYAGEQNDLATHVEKMTEQLKLYSDKIGEGIDESANAIDASVRMSASQNKNAAILLERLDEQLSTLEDLNRQIRDNTTNFTKESSDYVSRTLDVFDTSLAEVVERLTFTTAEIRDAVDALPQMIRGVGPNHG